MAHMVNKANTRWLAANLISGHLAHAGNHRHGTAGHSHGWCSAQSAHRPWEVSEAVAAGSPYRYPLWLARALNSAIYDVKWDYESYRAIARIAVFSVKIAVFIINLCCCAPFCNYTRDFTVFPCFHRHLCSFERPVANALEQFKQLKPTHEMFDSCRNCGALQEGHGNASKLF